MRKTIKIHPSDNVAVALVPLTAGARIGEGRAEVIVVSDIPRGHKVSLIDIDPGEPVIRYGFPIGRATRKISAGDWVHTHNLETALGQNVEYHYSPEQANDDVRASTSAPFRENAPHGGFELTQRMLWEMLDDFVLVTEEEIQQALVFYIEKAHSLAEGAGSAALAAASKMCAQLSG